MRIAAIGKFFLFFLMVSILHTFNNESHAQQWILINQLGYTCKGSKVAVWASKEDKTPGTFQLADAATGKIVYTATAGSSTGPYGPFLQSVRLKFSGFIQPGCF